MLSLIDVEVLSDALTERDILSECSEPLVYSTLVVPVLLISAITFLTDAFPSFCSPIVVPMV